MTFAKVTPPSRLGPEKTNPGRPPNRHPTVMQTTSWQNWTYYLGGPTPERPLGSLQFATMSSNEGLQTRKASIRTYVTSKPSVNSLSDPTMKPGSLSPSNKMCSLSCRPSPRSHSLGRSFSMLHTSYSSSYNNMSTTSSCHCPPKLPVTSCTEATKPSVNCMLLRPPSNINGP